MKIYTPYFILFINIFLFYNSQLFAQKKGEFTESEQKIIKEKLEDLFVSYQLFGKLTEGPAFPFSESYAQQFKELFANEEARIYNIVKNDATKKSLENTTITLNEYIANARMFYEGGFNVVMLKKYQYDESKKIYSNNNKYPYEISIKTKLIIEGRSSNELLVSEKDVNLIVVFSKDLQDFRFAEQKTTIKDIDRDGIPDFEDNCPERANPKQKDSNGNGIGDVCEEIKLPKGEPQGKRIYFDFSANANISKMFSQNSTTINGEYHENLSNLTSAFRIGGGFTTNILYFFSEKIGLSTGLGIEHFSSNMNQSISTNYMYDDLYFIDKTNRNVKADNFQENNEHIFVHVPLQIHYQNYDVGRQYKRCLEISMGFSLGVPIHLATVVKGNFHIYNEYDTLAIVGSEDINVDYTIDYNEPLNASEAFVNEIHGLYTEKEFLVFPSPEGNVSNKQAINIFGLLSAGYSFGYKKNSNWNYYAGLNLKVSMIDLFKSRKTNDTPIALLGQREVNEDNEDNNSAPLYGTIEALDNFEYNSIYNSNTHFRILSPSIVLAVRYSFLNKKE